jgi:thiosulfate dehydrogenase (quinone) large subunit
MSQGSSMSYRDRSPAFWLAVVAVVTLVIVYLGDLLASLGLEDLARTWNDDLLGFSIAGITLNGVLTVIFWISSIALVVVLFASRKEPGAEDVEIETPAVARFLFFNSRAGLLWLPIRVFLGFAWLDAGLHKLVDEAWRDGTALAGFWGRIVVIPEEGRPTITYDWYRDFLQFFIDGGHEGWFSWLIILGEVAVGLGLLFGALTGIAAFFGALMNMSFLLAGSASTNPIMFTLAIGLILAWRVAGYYGLDRYLLPRMGTPWRPGRGPSSGSAPPVGSEPA